MRLTIIRSMGLVHIDGRGHDELDMSNVPEDVHALQWYNDHGDIEFVDNTPNQDISELPSWAVSQADAAKARLADEDAEKAAAEEYAASPEGKAAAARSERDDLLKETDWWASTDVTMTDAQSAYRQALRDITSQAGFPESIDWPIKP